MLIKRLDLQPQHLVFRSNHVRFLGGGIVDNRMLFGISGMDNYSQIGFFLNIASGNLAFFKISDCDR